MTALWIQPLNTLRISMVSYLQDPSWSTFHSSFSTQVSLLFTLVGLTSTPIAYRAPW